MEHTYVLYDQTKACVIVDPGCYEPHEKKMLSAFIQTHELQVVQLLNTHCHIDHVLGNHYVKDIYQVKLAIHEQEVPLLASVASYAPQYGMMNYEASKADSCLEEGDQVQFGETILEVLHVPGHSPGHIAFYNQETSMCFAGDVLFQGSIGRTDLPGGDHATLIQSIHQKIFSLSDKMVIYPGHGPITTIGEEKKTNPFCRL